MNFRCDLTCNDAKQLAADNNIHALVVADQLLKAKDYDTELLHRFYEEPINFLPTFKYDKNSEVYDTSKKQRTPSYTDRILYSLNEGHRRAGEYTIDSPDTQRWNGNQVIVDYYGRRESTFSDHRPVLGIF